MEGERSLVVRDYIPDRRRKLETVLKALDALEPTALLDLRKLAVSLGYDISEDGMDQPVSARGYRLLSRVPRLPDRMIERLVDKFGSLQRLMDASLDDLDAVEGIGESRARSIKEGLARLAESSIFERYA